ncbi:MAG TPA: M3 family oligoendopeptidase [Chloroflexia bacterium]|nr:M3 family oligoendopeptidase [Chloroflexia bacterium]
MSTGTESTTGITSGTRSLPHWDMTPVYPGLESPEFEAGYRSAVQSIDDLVRLFDSLQIGRQDSLTLDEETVQAFETVIERLNNVVEETNTLGAYIRSFVSTDSRDNVAQARLSEFQQQTVRLSQLGPRFTAWIGSMDVEKLIAQSKIAPDYSFMLRKARKQAEHLMPPGEEELAAELNVTGGSAWGKLHGNITSQLSVTVEIGGEKKKLPMSMVRNLAYESDRETRRSAYEAELEGWKTVAMPLAAALNSIKGEVNALSSRRGWNSALDVAIFDSNIDREALDAMMQAARESFPDFRRYLNAKARALDIDKMAWYDIFAPVGKDIKVWEYDEATEFIVSQFRTYSQKMSDFAARAFRENWIDAEPRPGKRDGAFCMPLRNDESRVFANYKPSYGGMSTLAHELGHGYHNVLRSTRKMLQRTTPMTLAETASIFCETIVRQAALKDADTQEQIYILEASLQGSCQVVVDISSRFLFESRMFEQRKKRELSVDELCSLMVEAQKETYGDGLDQEKLHPYMWAMKPHYYNTGLSFYNFPYMFGLLFGLGLYARYRQDPEGFKTGYDDLLASTGMDDAATLAGRFGIDIRTPDFWRASFDIIRGDIKRFEELTQTTK